LNALQIKRLKARATNGDEMTLTLVRDLQTQLQHFEKQLIDTNSRKEKKTSNFENHSAQNTGIGVFFSLDNVNRYCIMLFIYFNVCRITF